MRPNKQWKYESPWFFKWIRHHSTEEPNIITRHNKPSLFLGQNACPIKWSILLFFNCYGTCKNVYSMRPPSPTHYSFSVPNFLFSISISGICKELCWGLALVGKWRYGRLLEYKPSALQLAELQCLEWRLWSKPDIVSDNKSLSLVNESVHFRRKGVKAVWVFSLLSLQARCGFKAKAL